MLQGLRGGYARLERDLLTAKDVIIAMPGELMESGTAGGAAKAFLRSAPTVILRPISGVNHLVGQTLMGATNSLDPDNRRRMENVSFSLCRQLPPLTNYSCFFYRNTRGIRSSMMT